MIIKIKNFKISNERMFVIAEAGINHNGEMELAKELIIQAAKCGADAVKFQTYRTENLLVKNRKTKGLFQELKQYELSYEDFTVLRDFAENVGIIFLSTADDLESLKFLSSLKLPAYKIGSGEMDNYLMLKKTAMLRKPVLLSTGASTEEELFQAYRTIARLNRKVIIMHCVSDYPAAAQNLNLNYIKHLIEHLKVPVGLSDHSASLIAPAMASYMGASVIEKHFTLDNRLAGPDHSFSLAPDAFSIMVANIREAEIMRGKGKKLMTKGETELQGKIRKSIYSTSEIEEGEPLNMDNTKLLRPVLGISAAKYEYFLGKKFITSKNAYKPVRPKDIE